MVKSLTAIGVSILLLLGLALFEWYFVHGQFEAFGEELETLYDKVEAETANGEDAKVVQAVWDRRKNKLHIWIPHNDITRMDDYLAEAVQLVADRNYALALPKLELLLHLCETVPGTFEPGIENIF